MRRLSIALIAAAALLGSAGAAAACSCVRQPSAQAQLDGSQVAFIGVAESIQRGPDGQAVTRLRVLEPIKGRIGRTVTLRHRTDSAACGVVFRPGERRLVLAGPDERGGLSTNLCAMPQFPDAEFRRAASDRPGRPPIGRPHSPRPPQARVCDADRARFAIGRWYTPRLGDRAREAAGAATLRVRRPGEMYTQEFREDRLNLDVSRRGVVRGAACG